MKNKIADCIIEKIKNEMKNHSFMESNRFSEKDFTRSRKLDFLNLITFMLNSNNHSLQKELTEFMRKFTKDSNVSKSAYSQQRIKLKPKAFRELNDILIQEFYTDNTINEWNGFRLLSIDGSTLELPSSLEIINKFGINNKNNMIPMTKISTLYDLKNNLILDSSIKPNNTNELKMAFDMLTKIRDKDLLILDRGYGARWFFSYFNLSNINYLVRIQRGFGKEIDAFWDEPEISKIIEVNELPPKSKIQSFQRKIEFKPFKFRLVKVILDNGEIEILATSLIDEKKYPQELFKELYFTRWGIEVNYDHLKNHIEIGNFTGFSEICIKQDFYASMLIANIQALIIRDAQAELDKKLEEKKNKYCYKINRNLSLGFLKDRIVEILISDNPNYMQELKELFQIVPVQIKPNRKFPRKEQNNKKKFYMNQRRGI